MNDLPVILQLFNVLIVPALVYVVRIDRRMGQIDALSTVNQKRIDQLEQKVDRMNEAMIRREYRAQ